MQGRPAKLLAIGFMASYWGLAMIAINAGITTLKAETHRDTANSDASPSTANVDAKPFVVAAPLATVIATEKAEVIAHSALRPDAVDLSSAERISIRVQGHTELTGEYRIGADGMVSVPVIGRISVNGMLPADLEAALAERIGKVTGRESFVTVEIADYKPVFVSGYVAKPGALSWRPGMTVLHALTLSGGTFRAVNQTGMPVGDDAELVRLQKAIADQKRNLAMLARLNAERNDLASIEMPSKLVALVGKAEAEQLIKSQQSSFKSRMSALEAKRSALGRAKEVTSRELAGIKAQVGRLNIQIDSRKDYKKKIDDLRSKGVVRAERSIEEFARVSDLEDRGISLSLAMARLQSLVANLEREEVTLEQGRIADLDGEISKAERDIAQLDIEIEAAKLSYRRLTGQDAPTAAVVSETRKKPVVQYEIVRQSGTLSNTFKSDQLVNLKPGDILVVSVD